MAEELSITVGHCPWHGHMQILKIYVLKSISKIFYTGTIIDFLRISVHPGTSVPLHGNKGTYLKMKFDILYKAQFKLGTVTKTFMTREEIKIAEQAKLWSSINFVCQHRSSSVVFNQRQGLRQDL